MPVLAFGIRFQPVAANVEPNWRIEGNLLRQEHVRQFVVESCRIFRRGKVATCHTPVTDGFHHPAYQLPYPSFPLRRINLTVQVL